MDIKEVLQNQIVFLDKVNQNLAEQLDGIEWIPEIRTNVELIRGLVQDIATLEQRLTIDDARVLVEKINLQDEQIKTLGENLTEAMASLEKLEDTIEIHEEENVIDDMLDRLEELEYKLLASKED